ncbi:hypothetical protein ACIQ7D_14690 [Streptomyces sp. NPDC096310]|uniref:hypothetical protein n=1 Tax=Streptomyces sp. NPDC096310 TaxID=3366082 RepID=UPI0037FE2C6B
MSLLIAAPLLSGAVHAREDFHAHRQVTEVDYSRPATVDLGDGASETSYPSRTVPAPWGTLAEGVLTGAAKRAGASFAVVLLVHSVLWQIGAVPRRPTTGPAGVSFPEERKADADTLPTKGDTR